MLQYLRMDNAAGSSVAGQATLRALIAIARVFLPSGFRGSLLVVLPGGNAVRLGQTDRQKEELRLTLKNWRAVNAIVRRGAMGLAEAYMDQDVECSDLVGLFRFHLVNRRRQARVFDGLPVSRAILRLFHRLRDNTRRGSRKNISEHYDLGNDFYRLWLDREMMYSSGLYVTGEETLETAQSRKVERILSLLDINRAHDILEIGCGWGGFARAIERTSGARVTAITLSREQLAYARQMAGTHASRYKLQDYRETAGRFDRVVSIEMLEAVGERHWDSYFSTLYKRLKPGGSAVIQSIVMEPKRFETYRRKVDFIQRYIFPGGMLPTARIIEEKAVEAGLHVEHAEFFGQSYALTLQAWRQRFEAAWPDIEKLGFDERFRRKWRYYLAYCEAGFADGQVDVGLFRLVKREAEQALDVTCCA